MRKTDFFKISSVDVNASTLANNATTNTDALSLKVGNDINHYVNIHLVGASFASSSLSIKAQQSFDGTNWVDCKDASTVALSTSATSGMIHFTTSAPYIRLSITKTGTDALTLTAQAGMSKDITSLEISSDSLPDIIYDSLEINVLSGGNEQCLILDQDDASNNPTVLKIENAGSGKDIETEALSLTNGKITLVDSVGFEVENAATGNAVALTVDQNDTTGNNTALKIENAGTGADIETESLDLTNGKVTLVDSIGLEIENAATGNAVALTIDQNDTTGNNIALKIENAGTGADIDTEALALTNGKITTKSTVGMEIETLSTSNAVALTIDQNDTTGNSAALVIENAGSGNDITAPSFALNAGTVTMVGLASGATATEINSYCDTSARLVAAGGTLSASVATHQEKIICLDTAAGSVVTLPAAAGTGARFRFAVTTTATSNSHIVKVANASDTMVGLINVFDQDGTAAGIYQGSGTDDTITMNRTTTGGIIGDYLEIIDLKANVWLVQGAITCVAGSNIADPFSATVS